MHRSYVARNSFSQYNKIIPANWTRIIGGTTMPDETISVFISYSHDSPQHEARVLALANRLHVC